MIRSKFTLFLMLIAGTIFALMYLFVHAIMIYPISLPKRCENRLNYLTPYGSLVGISSSDTVFFWQEKITANLICPDKQSYVTLPLYKCPSTSLSPELEDFIAKRCLSTGQLIEGMMEIFEGDVEVMFRTSNRIHLGENIFQPVSSFTDIRQIPFGEYYLKLPATSGSATSVIYERIDSFIHRLHRREYHIPTVSQLRRIGQCLEIVSTTNNIPRAAGEVQMNDWINIVQYDNELVHYLYLEHIGRFDGEDKVCGICLEEGATVACSHHAGEALQPLLIAVNCGHEFHEGCIMHWLRKSGSNSCPICKAKNIYY